MNLNEIKQALARGERVHWANNGYEVIKDNIGQYLIKCLFNNYCIGLYGKNERLNGKPDQFYIHGDAEGKARAAAANWRPGK